MPKITEDLFVIHLEKLLSGNIKVTWNQMQNITGYEIWREDSRGNKIIIGATDANAISFTDRNTLEEGEYTYQVISIEKKGEDKKYKNFSNLKTIAKSNANYNLKNTEKDTDVKSIGELKMIVNNVPSGAVRLRWDAVSGAIKYEIRRKQGNESVISLGVFNSDVTRFTDRNAIKGNKYFYQVVAYMNNEAKVYQYFSKIESICAGAKPRKKLNKVNSNPKSNNNLEADFDNMDGHQFEFFCADLLRKNGFENVTVTQGSGDQGIDIIAFKDYIKYGIQCKCYYSDIGNKAVQEVFAGKTFYQCHVGVVLTNRYFTKAAVELAQHNGVVLWNRDKLLRMIEKKK